MLSLSLSGVWTNLDFGLKIYTVLLGIGAFISLIFQFLSIFKGNEFKKQSFYVLWAIILFIGLMTFPAFFPPSFKDWKTYASVVVFIIAYFKSVFVLSDFFG